MSLRPFTAELVRELERAFAVAPHKRAAHHLARPLLAQMAKEPALLREALTEYVSKPESLNRNNYPVIAVPVAATPAFELVMNCWIPLPSGDTNVTTKAIHHHGDLLLSTTNIFGPGYEHWTFSRPREQRNQFYSMSLIQVEAHGLGHVAFVDAYVPHVPMFPRSLSITIALWSTRFETSWKDRAKKVPLMRDHAASLRRLAIALGLKRALELKMADNFDFFPEHGGFRVMKERKEFDLGPNADHLYSLFHVLQQTNNAALAAHVRGVPKRALLRNRGLIEKLLESLERDSRIDPKLSSGHFNVPFANFRSDEIRRALAELEPRVWSSGVEYAC